MLYVIKDFMFGGYKELFPFVPYVLLGVILLGVIFTTLLDIFCVKEYQDGSNERSKVNSK
jgi:hypothetical protein